ncbi:MAG: hypothetical protein AAFP67_07410 [Pseudomonadota bacterium]
MMFAMVLEIAGVCVLAVIWMAAILRLIERRRWSPLRPVVMAVVCAGCLALMADTLVDWAATGDLRSTFYVAAWNLGMALFDLRLTLSLSRRGKLDYHIGDVRAETRGGRAKETAVFAVE